MSDMREWLVRQNFEHERDYHYLKFREHHWTIPEIVAACPDPALREKMLRGFWNQDAERRFPEYRATVAGLSMAELENQREEWIETLDLLGTLDYRKRLAEASISPANDNERRIDR